MSLKNYVLATETINTPGGVIVVRGLSSADLIPVVARYRAEANALFAEYAKGGVKLDNPTALATALLTEAPQVITMLIAAAAGDGDEADIAMAAKLPLPVQVDILMAIGRLTLSTEGGLKKLAETVMQAMQGITASLANLQA